LFDRDHSIDGNRSAKAEAPPNVGGELILEVSVSGGSTDSFADYVRKARSVSSMAAGGSDDNDGEVACVIHVILSR
jgi:hypothetical protein